MIDLALGSPARAVVLAMVIALMSSGSLSARAENPSSPDETAGFLSTRSPERLGTSDAPVCQVDDAAQRSARVDTGARIAQIRALIAAEAAAAGSGGEEGFVAISNRGYNYDANTVVDPSLIEFEARRQGR